MRIERTRRTQKVVTDWSEIFWVAVFTAAANDIKKWYKAIHKVEKNEERHIPEPNMTIDQFECWKDEEIIETLDALSEMAHEQTAWKTIKEIVFSNLA